MFEVKMAYLIVKTTTNNKKDAEDDSYRKVGQLSREIPDFENWRKQILGE